MFVLLPYAFSLRSRQKICCLFYNHKGRGTPCCWTNFFGRNRKFRQTCKSPMTLLIFFSPAKINICGVTWNRLSENWKVWANWIKAKALKPEPKPSQKPFFHILPILEGFHVAVFPWDLAEKKLSTESEKANKITSLLLTIICRLETSCVQNLLLCIRIWKVSLNT